MSRANFGVFEQSEFTEFAANVNFYPLRNLASDELFFTSFIKFATALLYFVKKLNKLLSNF